MLATAVRAPKHVTRPLRHHYFNPGPFALSRSPFWDFEAIAASSLTKIMTMDTYGTWPEFVAGLDKVMSVMRDHGGVSRLGIGLCTRCATVNETELAQRFDAIASAGVLEVDVWALPIPSNWYPHF